MKAKLRAVEDGERPQIASVEDAVLHGSRLDEFVEMRKVIARAIDTTASARDLAALTKRLTEISKEIDVLRRQAVEEAQSGGVSEDEEFDAEVI